MSQQNNPGFDGEVLWPSENALGNQMASLADYHGELAMENITTSDSLFSDVSDLVRMTDDMFATPSVECN